MQKVFIILIALVYTPGLRGQSTESTPGQPGRHNFKYFFGRDTSANRKKPTRLDVQLDFRSSFIRSFPIDIYGGNLGIIFLHRFRIGTGYYLFTKRFSDQLLGLRPSTGKPYTDSKGRPIPVSKLSSKQPYVAASQNLEVQFGCINFTYLFHTSRLLELYIPVELGYGAFNEKLVDPSGYDFNSLPRAPTASSGSFWPGQIGLLALTKVHRWVYLLTAIGYRKTFWQKFTAESEFTNFESEFDSYYYRLGIQVQFGSIWKSKRKGD